MKGNRLLLTLLATWESGNIGRIVSIIDKESIRMKGLDDFAFNLRILFCKRKLASSEKSLLRLFNLNKNPS